MPGGWIYGTTKGAGNTEKFPECLIISVRGSFLCSAPQAHSERWPWTLAQHLQPEFTLYQLHVSSHRAQRCLAAHFWDLPISSHLPRQDLTRIFWNCTLEQSSDTSLLPPAGFKTFHSSFPARRDLPERIQLQHHRYFILHNRRDY